MTASIAGTRRQIPRWWRRFVVTSRRQNLFGYIEVTAAVAFLIMVASTWATFTNAPPDGALLPSRQVAGLLIGTLIPAMALLVLARAYLVDDLTSLCEGGLLHLLDDGVNDGLLDDGISLDDECMQHLARRFSQLSIVLRNLLAILQIDLHPLFERRVRL